MFLYNWVSLAFLTPGTAPPISSVPWMNRQKHPIPWFLLYLLFRYPSFAFDIFLVELKTVRYCYLDHFGSTWMPGLQLSMLHTVIAPEVCARGKKGSVKEDWGAN